MNETYSIEVRKDGVPLFKRTLTVWPKDLNATEKKGMQIGKELARDAIHHAGLWNEFECQKSKES